MKHHLSIKIIVATMMIAFITGDLVARDFNTTNNNMLTRNRYRTPSRMYFLLGSGAQMYIGNEVDDSAKFSPVQPNFMMEYGYKLTAEVGVAVNLTLFPAKRYSNMLGGENGHPMISMDGITPDPRYTPDKYWSVYPYQEYNMFCMQLSFLFTFDWTNIIMGYDYRQSSFHVVTPVGMGWGVATGKRNNKVWSGNIPWNNEFSVNFGVLFDYQFSDDIGMYICPRLYVTRGSWDFSYPQGNIVGKFDLVPMVNVGIKFAIARTIKWITR